MTTHRGDIPPFLAPPHRTAASDMSHFAFLKTEWPGVFEALRSRALSCGRRGHASP